MKINQIIVFILSFISIQQVCHAQVGINQDNPSDSAILHISSDSKGVLFPAPVVDKINNNKKDGLFYYNSNEKRFYHYNKNLQSWQCVNPFNAEDTSNIKAPGNLSVQKNLTIKNGKVTVKGGNLEVNKSNNHMIKGYGTTPIGGIIMWSGKISNIPDGWALCDGKKHNGRQTPDLRGRFIVGYSEKYDDENVNNETYDTNYIKSTLDTTFEYKKCLTNPKTGEVSCFWQETEFCNLKSLDCRIDTITGGTRTNNAINNHYNHIGAHAGEEQHKLKVSELPHHKHKINLTTSYDGKHTHSSNAVKVNSKKVGKNAGSGEKAQEHKPDATIYESGNHYHEINGNTQDGSSNNIQGSAHENRPPYYVLAFIMRVK
jgi:microcystin-dependent protein